VRSLSAPGNPLADCDLTVDLDALPPGGAGGRWNLTFHGGGGDGNATLDSAFDGPLFTNNVLPRAPAANFSHYPGNLFPAGDLDVGFADYSNGNYRLTLSSPYRNAGTDGRDIGADIAGLDAATYGCASGDWRRGAEGPLFLMR
jgi:hypothetical protein